MLPGFGSLVAGGAGGNPYKSVSSGTLIGYWDGTSYNASTATWSDLSGNGNHCTGCSGISVVQRNGFGMTKTNPVLNGPGSSSATILWPFTMPATWTMFYVDRLQTAGTGRVLQGQDINWLTGHWGGYSGGECYHNGWMTHLAQDLYGANFFLGTDRGDWLRNNGITRGGPAGSPTTGCRLCVGGPAVYVAEAAAFEIAEVVMYNGQLSAGDIQTVESYLNSKYGLF